MRLTCEEKEDKGHDEGVAEVKEGGRESLDLQLCCVVVQWIQEEIDGSEAAGKEGTPPPAIVLGAQVEIAEQNGCLQACDDQDEKDHG